MWFRVVKKSGFLAAIAAAAVAGLTLGCADQLGPDATSAIGGSQTRIPASIGGPLPGDVVEDPVIVRRLDPDPGTISPEEQASPSGSEFDCTALISAALGGSISNGIITLDFPPGALDVDTEITLDMDDEGYYLADMTPAGLQFNVPVLLTFDLGGSTAEGDASNTYVAWFDESINQWVMITNLPPSDPNHIHGMLEHFSKYSGVGG